jgi:Sec-independent protein translocase protein TatA
MTRFRGHPEKLPDLVGQAGRRIRPGKRETIEE